MGGKMNISNEKVFFRSINFKLLSQMKGNSINDCDFFKVYNFCYGTVIVIARPGRQENLATPLGMSSGLF
jgi:hypothetical protein